MENENNNNFIEGQKVENTARDYTAVKQISSKKSFSFGKQVVVPFVSGVVGASVVLGSCFAIPSVKGNLFGETVNNNSSNTSSTINNSSTTNANTSLVSLVNYSDTSIGVAKKILPSIVSIKVEYSVSSIFYRDTGTASASGSGVIISEDGYILTNNHVVNSSSTSSFYEIGKANKITVTLNGDDTEYEATIIGTDDQTDLAVIKIDKTGLTAAELGDSDSVQVGEFVMTVGNPLNMNGSIFSGIISAVDRKITVDGVNYTLIQTDAAINSGISGGALVNSKGQVIGITTLKMSASGVEGIGFAIPINTTKPIFEQLIEYKKVKRPFIGISGRDLSEELAKANNLPVGVYVLSIEEFSAAEKAGLKIGDVITAIDGTKVKTMNELNSIKNTHKIGDTITLTITRDGNEKTLSVTLKEQ